MSVRLWSRSTIIPIGGWMPTDITAEVQHDNYERQHFKEYIWRKEEVNMIKAHNPTGVHEVPAARNNLETRAVASGVVERRMFTATEVRVVREKDKPTKLVGYAAVFNSDSQPLSLVGKDGKKRSFIESIAPGAFARCLADGRLDAALVGHDANQPLARRSAGTLKLWEDEKGLAFEATPPDTTRSRDCITDVESGNIKGVSFGFGDDTKDEWSRDAGGMLRRKLLDIDGREISPTPFPAYEGTSVGVRSMAALDTLEQRDHPGDYKTVATHAGWMARSCRSMSENMMSCRDVLAGHSGKMSDDEAQNVRDLHDSMKELSKRCGEVRSLTRAKLAEADPEGDEDDDEQEEGGDQRAASATSTAEVPLDAKLTGYAARARLLELEQRERLDA